MVRTSFFNYWSETPTPQRFDEPRRCGVRASELRRITFDLGRCSLILPDGVEDTLELRERVQWACLHVVQSVLADAQLERWQAEIDRYRAEADAFQYRMRGMWAESGYKPKPKIKGLFGEDINPEEFK